MYLLSAFTMLTCRSAPPTIPSLLLAGVPNDVVCASISGLRVSQTQILYCLLSFEGSIYLKKLAQIMQMPQFFKFLPFSTLFSQKSRLILIFLQFKRIRMGTSTLGTHTLVCVLSWDRYLQNLQVSYKNNIQTSLLRSQELEPCQAQSLERFCAGCYVLSKHHLLELSSVEVNSS